MLAITLVATVTLAFAQKATTAGPTKVTGDPTKTASGLEYWDIKVGTGAVAQAGICSAILPLPRIAGHLVSLFERAAA